MGVVKVYEHLLEDLQRKHVEVPQPCALQLFYDLKFLAGVLTPPRDSEVCQRLLSVGGSWTFHRELFCVLDQAGIFIVNCPKKKKKKLTAMLGRGSLA